jgi:hypothetical protein
MIKVTESEQKSILKIFVGFTIISLITFFAITSIYINQNFGQTLLDIVKNSRELELGFIAKNVEQYIENRTQALKDIGSNPLLINSLLRSQGDQASEDFLTHSLILGEKAPITLYDSSGKKIVSSEKQIGTELDQTLLSKIISQEKSYIVNIIGKPDDAIMQISVPILYKSSIKGIIVLESKIDYSRIFGIYNPNHLSFGFQSDERIFHAENFKKIEGDKYQKYIPNLNLVVFFKASEDFYKSKIQKNNY